MKVFEYTQITNPLRLKLGRMIILFALLTTACQTGNASDRTLVGPTWLAEDIGQGGVVNTARTTIKFSEDGRHSGLGACNHFQGKADIDGKSIRFGPIAATRKLCPDGVMDQEDRFFQAMDKTRRYRIDGSFLYFIGDDGKDLVRFSALDE